MGAAGVTPADEVALAVVIVVGRRDGDADAGESLAGGGGEGVARGGLVGGVQEPAEMESDDVVFAIAIEIKPGQFSKSAVASINMAAVHAFAPLLLLYFSLPREKIDVRLGIAITLRAITATQYE